MNKVKMIIDNNVVLNNIEEFKLGNSALIVTGKNSAKKSGALDDVLNVLDKLSINYLIYDGITQNPSITSCMEAGKLGKDLDYVIGVGGGSPLDAAKAIAIFMANSNLSEDDFYNKNWKVVKDIILIGTTAGTGSEVTKVSVLTDTKGKKHSIHDDLIYAEVSLGDPKYTLSLSKEFTVSTGIDAIAHATESYFSNSANDESRTYSIKAINLMYNDLIYLLDHDDLSQEQRSNLYKGSIEAGYAIDITGTTFAHNVGYYLTEQYHLSHGFASAIFLDDVLTYQKKNNNSYFNQFIKDINMSEEEFLKLYQLIPNFNIKFSEEELKNILPRWDNNNSVKKTYGNMTVKDIEEILTKKFM